MKKKDDVELRIHPNSRACTKFNLQSLSTFPIADPEKIGMRVLDDCAEEHIM